MNRSFRLPEHQRVVLTPEIDEGVPAIASRADEKASVVIDLGGDGLEQHAQPAMHACPHGIVSDSVGTQHSTVADELARMQADGLIQAGRDGRISLTRAGRAYASARGKRP